MMGTVRRCSSASIILAFLLAAAAVRPAMAQVTITDIGTINGRSSTGLGINHAGDVAGSSYVTGTVGTINGPGPEPFVSHAVLFSGGVLHDLGAIEGIPACGQFGCASMGLGINDSGWVVGWTTGVNGYAPMVWFPTAVPGGSAGINVLPILDPNHGAQALAINNAGQIVGLSGGIVRALLWQLTPGGPTVTDLGTLRADNQGSAGALAINDLGQAAGGASDETWQLHAFLYLPAPAYGLRAGMNNLTPTLAYGAGATGINNRGEVVGSLDTGAAFVWLPAPAYGLPAGFSALTMPRNYLAFAPYGISDDGQIVGEAYLKDPSTGSYKRTAGAWSKGRWMLLNDLLPGNSPWDLRYPSAVTHKGKTTLITGWGILAGATDVSGFDIATHGFVLSVTCTGDLNDDGVVDQTDVDLLIKQLGQSVTPGTGADLNGDGVVNQQDLVILGQQIHQPCM